MQILPITPKRVEKIKLTSPQLMEMPSLARSPVAPVLLSLSEPARSTKWNLADSVSNSLMSELPARRLSVALSWRIEERKKN